MALTYNGEATFSGRNINQLQSILSEIMPLVDKRTADGLNAFWRRTTRNRAGLAQNTRNSSTNKEINKLVQSIQKLHGADLRLSRSLGQAFKGLKLSGLVRNKWTEKQLLGSVQTFTLLNALSGSTGNRGGFLSLTGRDIKRSMQPLVNVLTILNRRLRGIGRSGETGNPNRNNEENSGGIGLAIAGGTIAAGIAIAEGAKAVLDGAEKIGLGEGALKAFNAQWGIPDNSTSGSQTYYPDLSKYHDRGSRNINPGNIKGSGYLGQIGKDDKNHAIFATKEAGVAGLVNRLYRYNQDKKKGDDLSGKKTIREIMYMYAPPNENDTEKYIQFISKRIGVNPNAQIDIRQHPEYIRPFVEAIMKYESQGHRAYSNEEINKGIEIGMDEQSMGKEQARAKHQAFLEGKKSNNSPILAQNTSIQRTSEEATTALTLNKNMWTETQAANRTLRYNYGSKGSEGNIDCSGWATRVLKKAGASPEIINMMEGKTSTQQIIDTGRKTGTLRDGVTDLYLADLKEGMLIGVKNKKSRELGIGHIGVVVKNPETGELGVSHASSSRKTVVWDPLPKFQRGMLASGASGFVLSDPLVASRNMEQQTREQEKNDPLKEAPIEPASPKEQQETAIALNQEQGNRLPASSNEPIRSEPTQNNPLPDIRMDNPIVPVTPPLNPVRETKAGQTTNSSDHSMASNKRAFPFDPVKKTFPGQAIDPSDHSLAYNRIPQSTEPIKESKKVEKPKSGFDWDWLNPLAPVTTVLDKTAEAIENFRLPWETPALNEPSQSKQTASKEPKEKPNNNRVQVNWETPTNVPGKTTASNGGPIVIPIPGASPGNNGNPGLGFLPFQVSSQAILQYQMDPLSPIYKG